MTLSKFSQEFKAGFYASEVAEVFDNLSYLIAKADAFGVTNYELTSTTHRKPSARSRNRTSAGTWR